MRISGITGARQLYLKARRFLARRKNLWQLSGREPAKRSNLALYRASIKSRCEVVSNDPLEIFLELSNRCNINCKMCALHDVKGGGTMMSWNTISQIVPLFSKAHRLHAHGFGEPLLNKNMWDLLETAKKNRLYVDFFTNGAMLDDERAERLVELQVDEITFSFDGATRETFEWVREGAEYDQVVSNINHLSRFKNLRGSSKPMIRVNFVAMTCNFREIEGVIELASSWGAEQIEIKPMVVYDFLPQMHSFRKVIDGPEDERLLAAAERLAAARGMTFNVSLPRKEATNRRGAGGGGSGAAPPESARRSAKQGNGFCWYPFRTIYVRADGNVKPCCFYWDRDHPGSLRDSTMREIWQGEGFRALRRQWAEGGVPPGCRHCEEFKLRPPYDDTEGVFARLQQAWR